jgi:transposase
MSQRTAILTEILGVRGWKVKDAFFEDEQGRRFEPVQGYGVLPDTRLVLVAERHWAPRCSQCGAICGVAAHEKLKARRWADLPWAGRPVALQAELIRVKCARCDATPVEMNAWAEPKQRQTHRLQQQLGLEAASMPVMHVAALHGLDWKTVRRAEGAALERWNAARPPLLLRRVGVDEKWLGRRHHLAHKFVTIVSNLDTGEPLWIGYGRDEATLQRWINTLTAERKAALTLVAADMHRPFLNAIRANKDLAHVPVVHDPFHLMKRAGKAVDETRREFFFRAGATMRSIGRGSRWLLLRAWERCSDDQHAKLKTLFAYNPRLARVLSGRRRVPRGAQCPHGRSDGHRAQPNPPPHPGAPEQGTAGLARLPRRTPHRDPRVGRAPPSHRAHRSAEHQLGGPCATGARLPRPRLPPAQAPLHDRQPHPKQGRGDPIPRPRVAASAASRRVILLARILAKSEYIRSSEPPPEASVAHRPREDAATARSAGQPSAGATRSRA